MIANMWAYKMGLLLEGQHILSLKHFMPPHVNFPCVLMRASANESAPGGMITRLLSANVQLWFLTLAVSEHVCSTLQFSYLPPSAHSLESNNCATVYLTHVVQGKHLKCWEFTISVLVQQQRLSFHSSLPSCGELQFWLLNLQGHSYHSIWGWFRIIVIGFEVYL